MSARRPKLCGFRFVAEAWRKQRYPKSFQSKMSDGKTEAYETRARLEFSLYSGFVSEALFDELDKKYDVVTAQLVTMINQKEKWTIQPQKKT
jgi:four helix bundle protein